MYSDGMSANMSLVSRVKRASLLFSSERDSIYGPSLHEISRVGPGLFLSGEPDRDDAERLRDLGIRNVLSVARECHDEWIGYDAAFQLVHLGFRDHLPIPPWLAVEVVRVLAALVRAGPTLVHCAMGVSRSPTAIALYWWASGQAASHAEAVARLQRLRPCVRPNAIVDGAVLAAVGRLRREWAEERKQRKGGRRAGA